MNNLKKAGYTGEHGFVMVEPKESAGAFDQEFFLGLHDWNGFLQGSDDGLMSPVYDVSTINGRRLGFGEPLRVKMGQRVLRMKEGRPVAELRRLPGHPELQDVLKDVVLVGAGAQVEVEFTADNPGKTLLHCHQQDHMDMGFMTLLRYA
jgi:Multicopper oxidase